MADQSRVSESKILSSSTKAPLKENEGGPIIEETQESEEYQQDLQVVLGTAFGVLAVVGLIALGLLLYRIYRARSQNLSRHSDNQNDDLHLFEQDFSLDDVESKPGHAKQPMVLILYAQDCPAHERAVAALAGLLMEAWGCLVTLDILEEEELARRGPEDWLLERLQEADFILTVCSLGARIRCTKRHLCFRKWAVLDPSANEVGHGGTPQKQSNMENEGSSVLNKDSVTQINSMEGKEILTNLDETIMNQDENKQPKEMSSKLNGSFYCKEVNQGEREDMSVRKGLTLTEDIPDYFAGAVDYVAEKMRVEREKGIGLRKFINVYFDYSARSDVPPQLEVAALYCLTRELKPLRQHLFGGVHRSPQHNNVSTDRELDAGISLAGDGSEKSEDLIELNDLETETGMLLVVTLDEARSFFRKNPTWMEEQVERAHTSYSPPSFASTPSPAGWHLPLNESPSPNSGFFHRKGGEGRKRRWRKRRRERRNNELQGYNGNCAQMESQRGFGKEIVSKKPLLERSAKVGTSSGSAVSSSSIFSPLHQEQKLIGHMDATRETGNLKHCVQEKRLWSNQDSDEACRAVDIRLFAERDDKKRSTLPRTNRSSTQITKRTSESLGFNENDAGSYVHSLINNLDNADFSYPRGIYYSRPNSLPSSLASGSSPTMATPGAPNPEKVKHPVTCTDSMQMSSLAPKSKLRGFSRSADSFARLGGCDRDLSQLLDHDGLPCVYCNNSHLEGWCSSCKWGRGKGTGLHGLSFKETPNDLDPVISSSAEGHPVFTQEVKFCGAERKKSHSSQSQKTIFQAEVHQVPTIDNNIDEHGSLKSVGSFHHVGSNEVMEKSQACHHVSKVPGGTSECYPRIQRWVSRLVDQPTLQAPNNYTTSQIVDLKIPVEYHWHSGVSVGGASVNDDAGSISSSSSLSDGDSLERDLRSINKISSFHDFVASSSFVDSYSMSQPRQTAVTTLPHTSQPPDASLSKLSTYHSPAV